MKAGIYNPYWDSLGGGERYTAAVIKFLQDQGWNVDIQFSRDVTSDVLDRFGIDITGANYVTHLKSNEYDLIFWVSDGSLPVSFAKKTLIHFQFPFQNVAGSNLINLLKSRFYKFISNSKFTAGVVDREFHIKSQVIYPPIDIKKFKSQKKENLIFYIGRFSSLTQLKGQSVLLKSFRNIKDQIPGWKLILAGGADVGLDKFEFEKLQNEAQGLPVEILTNPTFAQVQRLCAVGQIFWSASGYSASEDREPTKVEHFGITVVEAMSAGAVPIITNLGGFKEIVETGKSGFLWNRPDELEKYTLELIRHPSRISLLSKEAVKRAKIFDVTVFNRELAQVI